MSRTRHTGLRLSTSAHLPGDHNGEKKHGFPRRLLYLVIACSVLVASLAALVLRREYQEQMQFSHEKLTHAADANQRLLENWIKERNEDTQLIASFPCTAIVAMSRARGDPAPPQPCRKRLQEQLVAVSNIYSYAGVYVLGGGGRVLAQSGDSPPLTWDVVKGVTVGSARAMAIPEPGGRAGYSRVAFGSPILHRNRSAARGEAAKPIGYVVLVTRRRAVAGLLWTDTGATATGETLLVTLQAGQPIFISPLRNWKGKGTLTAPAPGSPARATLLQRHSFYGRYRDYRGASVLVATRFVPELGWGMVTKVDRKEALSAFQQTLILGVSIALLTILTIVSAAVAWLRHRRVQRLQTDLVRGRESEENLRRSQERFWVALENSPVVVFNQDRELRYTWINKPVPPWSEVDYLGKTDEEIIGVADGSRLSALKRPVLESGVGARKEWSFVYRSQRRDFDINIQPLRNEAGEIAGITCASTDITERKRAEEQLKESERKYRRLFETTEAFGQTDMAGHLREFNPAYQHMLGYSAGELLQLNYRDLTPQRWHAAEDQIIEQQVLQRGYSDIYEKEYRRKDGTVFPVELRAFLIRDDAGQPVGMWAVVRDITERKRAEERLREYEKVVEGLQEMIAVVDREYRYLIANRAYLNYCGFEQVIGHPLREVLDPDVFHGVVTEKLDECLQGKVVTYEVKYTFPKLGERDVCVSYFPIEGPTGVDRVACVLQDITERKRAEKALRDSEAQLRAFMDHAPYAIFRYANDHFLSANPALVQMLGYSNEPEVLALSVAGDVFHPSAECRDLMAISGRQPQFGPVEARWKRRDGSLLLARLRGRVAQNGEETIEAIAEDITRQRALEEHLGQSDRLEALGRLASGVAHDINNLLLGITLNLERAIRQAEPPNSPLREDIEQSLQAARGAAAVIRQLLVFGRKRPRQQQAVNLNDVIIRSLDLVHHLAGENIHVNLQLGQNLGLVTADPIHVQQVVLNLVANARDAMAGKGQIKISTRNIDLQSPPAGEYFTAAPQAGNYAVLEVSDTGAGISREALAHIFEPFYTTKKEGCGLGLSTSYGIVTQNSGYMSVRTESGHGTAVRSYLPRLAEASHGTGLRRVS
jgi:PAS domain S-box-containing protein